LDKVTELQKQILEFNANQIELTPTNLLSANKSTIKVKTVDEFYTELILHFSQTNKTGNRLIYKGSYNSIKDFSKGRLNILFSDIDVNWLDRYEKWLRAKGNKETTISLLFRTLRSAYNKAVELKCTSKSNYPFNDFKISKFDVKTKKRAISKDDILRIITVDLSQEKETFEFSRDIFVFSYLGGGINFTDISNLRPDDINENRIQYIRQKTGKKMSFHLVDETIRILLKYNQLAKKTGYLFPILDKRLHKTALQKQNRIHKILIKINRELKRIAEIAEIKMNLSTYVARHSFATILKNSGVNISLISEALGHSELSTTMIYLDSFENSQIDEAMKCLL
jgi:integrase